MHIKNVLYKTKLLWIELFTILFANYKSNNNSLYLSINWSLNLIYYTFEMSKIKSYINNDCTVLEQYQLGKPALVT